jgi:hypothetical protein
MQPQFRESAVVRMLDMDTRKIHESPTSLRGSCYEPNGMITAADHIVHLGSEGATGQFGDLTELALHLFLSDVVARDARPSGYVEDEVVGESVEIHR